MKRIVITGASRGIGRAIAEKLAGPGLELLLHGRDAAALAEVSALLQSKAGKLTIVRCDLATTSGVEDLIKATGEDPIDVLINNAGIAMVKPLAEITKDDWERTLAINVTAPFLLTQHCAPRMRAGGSIVNILSVAAKTGFENWGAYCMSKFALEGFSQSVRAELRQSKVRVINIYPAATNTEIWNAVTGDWPREKMMLPGEVAAAVAYALSRPGEVALENITLTNVTGAL